MMIIEKGNIQEISTEMWSLMNTSGMLSVD
jgi:hypothetical protein